MRRRSAPCLLLGPLFAACKPWVRASACVRNVWQVSLEEKIWECEETKKICFNQTQMDQHKRRVPEAVTWTEKTVGDLQKAWKEKAGSSAAGEVESEEDMLLRAAGKKPKGKGAAEPAGPPVVTKVCGSSLGLSLQ